MMSDYDVRDEDTSMVFSISYLESLFVKREETGDLAMLMFCKKANDEMTCSRYTNW